MVIGRCGSCWCILVLVLLLGVKVFSKCLDQAPPVQQKATVRIAVNSWIASELNAKIAKILLTEVMGIPVELVNISEYAMWDELAAGNLHICLEVWPSGHVERIRSYVQQKRTVTVAGPLGVIGQIGWYTQSFVLTKESAVAVSFFYTSNAVTSIFNHTFYSGPLSWTNYDESIITKNNYSLNVQYLGGEEELIDLIVGSTSKGQAALFYFWSPHGIFGEYSLFRVALPADAEHNYYPPDILLKVVSAQLKDISPSASFFASTFYLRTNDQIDMLALVRKGMDIDTVACDWVRNNTALWGTWIDLPPNLEAYISWSDVIGICSAILSALVATFTLSFGVFFLIFRNHFIVLSAGSAFLQLILLGCLLMSLSPLGLIGYASPSNCYFSIFLFGMGFTICWGCVVLKEFRIYLIYKRVKRLKRAKNYSDFYMTKFLLPFLILEICIDLLWMYLAPVDTAYGYCGIKSSSNVILTIYIFYKFMLLVMCCLLAIKTRNMSTRYSESRSLAIGIYSFSVIQIIVVILSLFLSVVGILFALSIGINIAILSFLLTVFGTKAHIVYQKRNEASPPGNLSSEKKRTSTAVDSA